MRRSSTETTRMTCDVLKPTLGGTHADTDSTSAIGNVDGGFAVLGAFDIGAGCRSAPRHLDTRFSQIEVQPGAGTPKYHGDVRAGRRRSDSHGQRYKRRR